MTSVNITLIVSFAFIRFTVIFTVGTASFVCIETNNKEKGEQ
jgi:hypothetical protein